MESRGSLLFDELEWNRELSSSLYKVTEEWVKGMYYFSNVILNCSHSLLFFSLYHVLIYLNSKPCGIRAARKLRVVRRQERWADKVLVVLFVFSCIEVQEGS